jgi:hypothetical protein
VAEFAERETDHQHDEQIDRAVDAAEQHLGQGRATRPRRSERPHTTEGRGFAATGVIGG